MKIKILGSSGTHCKGYFSTSALLNEDVLIDAGTGALNLSLADIEKISDVLITHSHLDHITALCFIAENRIGGAYGHGLNIYTMKPTAQAIREGLLNDKIWPDFENIIIQNLPLMTFKELGLFTRINIKGSEVTPFPVFHVAVPTVGFCFHGRDENFVFISDLHEMPDETYDYLNNLQNFRRLTIEISYPDGQESIAKASGHLTPGRLEDILKKLPADIEVFYSHVKPRYEDIIAKQVEDRFKGKVKPLKINMVFDID